jgi:hypothetical protein
MQWGRNRYVIKESRENDIMKENTWRRYREMKQIRGEIRLK